MRPRAVIVHWGQDRSSDRFLRLRHWRVEYRVFPGARNRRSSPYDEKMEKMTLDGTHVSLHDRRIKVIVDVLREDPLSATNAA